VALLYGGLKFRPERPAEFGGRSGEPAPPHANRPDRGGRLGTTRRVGEKGVKISIIVSEVEAVGGFVGSSFCDPLLNAGSC
jgi:hypothetical protein